RPYERVLTRSIPQISAIRQRINVQPRFDPWCYGTGKRAGRDRLIGTTQRCSHSSARGQDALMGQRVGNVRRRGRTETVTKSFVAAEEKRFVLLNRSADCASELVAFERRLLTSEFVVFPLRCIQSVIPQEFKCGSMQLIGSGAGDRREDATGSTPIFSAVAIR